MYSPDNKEHTTSGIIAFFSSILSGEGREAPSTSERPLQSFLSHCTNKDFTPQSDFFTIAADWIVGLQMNGAALGTVTRYIKGLSGYYTRAVKEGLAPQTEAFKSLTDKPQHGGAEPWTGSVTRQDFDKFLALTRLPGCRPEENNVAADMVTLSLINGRMPLYEVAMLKVDEAMKLDRESQAIANRHREPARKYVFPLRQSMLTKRQLTDGVNRLVMDYLQKRNIRCFTTADETLKTYWAYAALRTGITPHALSASLGSAPSGLQILSLFPKAESANPDTPETIASVAGIFLSNPLRWYAMRLRTRVSFAELNNRFAQQKDEITAPEMFYPCEEISKRTGKKIVLENKPIIGNIVFFRARVTDILPIFYRIGDLAWCYKYTNESGSAYAAIPCESFILFQQAIGRFTADYEVAPIGDLTPQVNDRVIVLGGPFQGINAVVQNIEKEEENTIYRLHFIGNNGIDYRLRVDSRMVRKG